MFAKKVYNFQVDQVWSVQVGVVETFDHLIRDDYVNLFACLLSTCRNSTKNVHI